MMKRLALMAAVSAVALSAQAQNAPVSGLAPRGAPLGTDLIPILPVGAPRLLGVSVSQLQGFVGGGTVTRVTCGAGLNGGTITTAGSCSLADPSATTLGGIESAAAIAHEWIDAISTGGVPSQTRPACGDLSDATYCGASLTNGITLANLAQAGANTVLGNFTGGTANVAANAMPSCPDSGGNHLNYTSGTGLACGTSTPAGSGVAPNLLKFGPPTVLPYYDPQPAGLIDVTDTFGSTGTFTQSNSGAGSVTTWSVAGNAGTLTTSGAIFSLYAETSDATLIAPQMFNAVTVNSNPAKGTSFASILVGVCKDATHYAMASYNPVGTPGFTLQYDIGGSITNVATKTVTLDLPTSIAFAIVDNAASIWTKAGTANATWVYQAGGSGKAAYNFETSGNLTGWKTCWGVASGGSTTTYTVSNLQGGRFGGVGMRDIKPVVNPDWTTYQAGANTIYFVATANEPSGAGTEGVFTLDLDNDAISETGVICDSRSSNIYCEDDAGNLIWHANGDRELLLSSWGDGTSVSTPVHALYKYVTSGGQGDLLVTNLSLMTGMTALTLPLGPNGQGTYDIAMAYDAANSRYLMAYTIIDNVTPAASTNFYPSLSTASTPTGTWTNIGMDTAIGPGDWEGTSLANIAGAFYLLDGGPYARPVSSMAVKNDSRVYDATMAYKGHLMGATFNGGSGPTPHPTLFDHPDGQHIVLFTFDGTLFGPTAAFFSGGQPMIEISTP